MPASLGIRSLHYGSPVNWQAPLNRDLVGWWVTLPLRSGGRYWRNLAARPFSAAPGGGDGAFTNMGASSATSGWGTTRRPGGWGEVRFDGTDDYVDASTLRVTFQSGGGLTWAGWVRPVAFPEWHSMFGFLNTTGTTPNILAYAHTSAAAGWGSVTAGVSVGWDNGGGGNLIVHSSNNALVAGAWHHVALVFDGTQTLANRWTIYVNGVDVTVRTGIGGGGISNFGALVYQFGRDTFGDPPWQGAMDDLRLTLRALSVSEVDALYLASRQRYPQELNWQVWPPAWASTAAIVAGKAPPPRRQPWRFMRRAA
jgi:hypothetical protein